VLDLTASLQIPRFTYEGVAPEDQFERVAAVAGAAEASGFDAVFVMDHFWQLPMMGPPDWDMFDGYTLLAALAARTERVKLGTLVTGVTYRNPAHLAKIVTNLDVISRGRAILGIGAAWY
jgi:alkanesulfonate monooxygenase SsuD/methylene tetrahydromethanopterin reductase-like flavin-dependent oxidoreductase (luciferase family)